MSGLLAHGIVRQPPKNGAPPGPEIEPESPGCVFSYPGSESATHMDDDGEMIITGIRATDVTLGLLRFPAGFHVTVHHSGLEWRTESKPVSVSSDAVEWREPIPIPSNLSADVSLTVWASFEFQPMLGDGEHLRELTVTVGQLLDHSASELPFVFLPKAGDVISPCSSFLVTARRGNNGSSGSSANVLEPHCPTPELPGQLVGTTNSGHSALLRYRKHEEEADLKHAMNQFELALRICPVEHPCRAVAQSNLAMAKLIYHLVYDANTSLDVPLTLYHNVLAARPAGHPDRPRTLIQLAALYLAQFGRRRDGINAAQAETLLREVMDLSLADSYENQAATFMLQLHGCSPGAVPASGQPPVHQDSALGPIDVDVGDLGVLLLCHFRQSGEVAVLQQAIAILETYLESASTRDPWYLDGLMNLSVALLCRFDRLGGLSDLEDAISRQRDAVALSPEGHPDNPRRLSNLSSSLLSRFKHLGELGDLEDAISRQRDAIDLNPDGHPDKPGRLNILSNSLKTRFERLGEISDLEEAISRQRDAVRLTADGHPDKPGHLNILGNILCSRFECFGELDDLEEAISMQRDAVHLTPDDHPNKPRYLSSLGNSCLSRFERLGEPDDLGEAVSKQWAAIRLTPDGHPAMAGRLNDLGSSLKARFDYLGDISDIDEAISRQTEAVKLTPDGHPDKPACLNNLGSSLLCRFECLGELRDLGDAISKQRDAVDLTPNGHPSKPRRLNNLGYSLLRRFERLGELGDLKDAIARQQDAISLVPDGHPDKPGYLNALGCFLCNRFKRLGSLADLEDAISKQQDAVGLVLDRHPDKSMYLNNLGIFLNMRFERLGELGDLENAISGQRDAVNLVPDGRPDKPGYLNSLGCFLCSRFKRLGELVDLEDAISQQQDAIKLTPDDHPDKPGRLHNLGMSLKIRFKHFGEIVDITEAISRQQDAVNLTPAGHPDKPRGLNNLCNSFLCRFEQLGEVDDLEGAISRQRDAVALMPGDHPERPAFLNNLGNVFHTRFKHLGEQSDLEKAIFSYSQAACAFASPVAVRFYASQRWIACARQLSHQSLLHAYSVAIGLLPQLAWIGLSLAHRYHELIEAADVVREAAAAALDSGRPETAVEWLEEGRSIVWGDLFQLRGSYDELSSAYPDAARRLRELSAALEQAGAIREKLLYLWQVERPYNADPCQVMSLQQEADRHRKLAIARDGLLREIRALPGFERFLLHKQFSHLRACAHSGPVVLLNAAKSRCDALIVLADVDHVIHVPLPLFTLKRSKDFQSTLKSVTRHAYDVPDDHREGRPIPQEGPGKWRPILAPLWKCVVEPVLDALAFSIPGDLSRIFWCPTGPMTFLPIHAAGLYDARFSEPGHKAFDFVVSSYVPTLSTLAPAPKGETASRSEVRLLAVRQPPSDGKRRLAGVVAELGHIKTIVENVGATFMESSVGTVAEVLSLMAGTDWVHFACHGVQDSIRPTESGLCLADGRRLRVTDMIALSRPRGGLAFLSACQTAKGDEDLSDEAIHIAAGMLFAGYGGVVGTMWSISDRVAPGVAKDVYEYLFRDGRRTADYREAARALHVAVGRLRESEEPFGDWLPFIHVGL